MPVRMLISLAALLLALVLPAAALAQGAGDEQYQDPFGEEPAQQEPAPTVTPAPAAPSQSAPAPTATPAPPSAPASSAPPGGDRLPYTGADAGLLALAGALLLGAGVALRRRADPGR